MLRISKEGRRTMKSLGVSVDPKFWNFDTNQPKPNCPNRQLIRQIVLKYETEYNGRNQRGRIYPADDCSRTKGAHQGADR